MKGNGGALRVTQEQSAERGGMPADGDVGLPAGGNGNSPADGSVSAPAIAAQHTPRNPPRGLPVLVIGVSPYGPAGRRGRQTAVAWAGYHGVALLASRQIACSAARGDTRCGP